MTIIVSNVNEWNNKTAEITGYSKNFALGKPLVPTFIMPELQKSVQYVLDQALHGNETSNYELEFCSASDEIRYLLGKSNATSAKQIEFLGDISLLTDNPCFEIVNATTRRDAENNIVGGTCGYF